MSAQYRHGHFSFFADAISRAVFGLLILGVASGLRAQDPPLYKVDPFWPKPLPNKWIMQQVPTLVVDKDDWT
jgi:hypothetical protein